MAWYIDSKNVKENKVETANEKYKKIWKPGEKPSFAGIYRCQSCGYEDLINRQCTKHGERFEMWLGSTRWRRLV